MKGQYDFRSLTAAILIQATEDHIKLQHSSKRRRAVERLAFATATSLLWDDDYVLSVRSPEGNELDLAELCLYASGRENADIKKLRTWLLQQIRDHWKGTKVIKKIPETINVSGHTYWLITPEMKGADFQIGIDFEAKEFRVDPKADNFQEVLICIVVDTILHHRNIKLDEHDRAAIAEDFLLMLQTNNLGLK